MFADIPGQARAKAYVAGALARGAGHAYLLAGPEGLGKQRFAVELGAALVAACGGCGHCAECERLTRGVHPDLVVIEREGEFIRIEQIAELIADLALRPFAATHRVWVIVEPERMNVEAANTFLKSLEEPPEHVHFILVSDSLERVLPTIVSRCQVVEFEPVADDELTAFLTDRESLDAERATVVARLAHGSLDRALRLVADERGPRHRERYLHLAAGIALHDRDAEHAFVDEVGNAEAAAQVEVEAGLALRRAELERTVPDDRERAFHTKRLDALQRREQARMARLAALRCTRPPHELSARRLGRGARRRRRRLKPRPAGGARTRGRRPARHLRPAARGRRAHPPGSVPEHRSQARSAGDVCPLPGGLGKCLRSSASSLVTAARSTISTPACSSSQPATRSSSRPPAAPTSGVSSKACASSPRASRARACAVSCAPPAPPTSSESPRTAPASARSCCSPASWPSRRACA